MLLSFRVLLDGPFHHFDGPRDKRLVVAERARLFHLLWARQLAACELDRYPDGGSLSSFVQAHDAALARNGFPVSHNGNCKVEPDAVAEIRFVGGVEKRAQHIHVAQQSCLGRAQLAENRQRSNREVNSGTSALFWERTAHYIQSSLTLLKMHVSSGGGRGAPGKLQFSAHFLSH
jgi:hypothetical protein